MAIFDHDEEMVGYLAEQINDPDEVKRQSIEAFQQALKNSACPEKAAAIKAQLETKNDASALDYQQAVMGKVENGELKYQDAIQYADAKALCAGLEDIFKATPTY